MCSGKWSSKGPFSTSMLVPGSVFDLRVPQPCLAWNLLFHCSRPRPDRKKSPVKRAIGSAARRFDTRRVTPSSGVSMDMRLEILLGMYLQLLPGWRLSWSKNFLIFSQASKDFQHILKPLEAPHCQTLPPYPLFHGCGYGQNLGDHGLSAKVE